MIEIKNVSKSYGKQQIISDLSLQLPKGKFISIIGPNGAGKSTLLSLISRLEKLDSGQVSIDGLDLATTSGKQLAKRLAILRQHNETSLRLTVADLVAFGRFPHSGGRLTPEDKEIIEEALDYLSLIPLKDKYLDELSGGQRQRAYIAMVMCQDTDYVLLDEPLNNLDMKFAVDLMQLLRQAVDKKNKTVILVLHDINFASCYSDHILALKDGDLAAQGDVETVIQSQVLSEIYNLPIQVQELKGQRISTYYR